MNKPKILYDVLMRLQPFSTDHTKITSIRDCWKIALGIENEKNTDLLKLRVKLADSVYKLQID